MNLKNLPEIEFAKADLEELLSSCQTVVESSLDRKIARADPIMLMIKSLLTVLLQERALIDWVAKQNLLAYAKGAALDHLGALVGVERLKAAAATCTVEIKLSAERIAATVIKAGTRITAGDGINFALDEAVVFASGETVKTAKATCQVVGEIGNGYGIGELKLIVDPQAYLYSIENVTKPEGGADEESDDNLRERIAIAPEKFTVAGSQKAYEFYVKGVSSLIKSVLVTSENPGEVDIYALLENGELPGEELLSAIEETLSAENIRPLTDQVFVKLPEIVEYEIDLKYWIESSAAYDAAVIQQAADSAVAKYILWQSESMGRDINPDELIKLLRLAGVKRVEINQPAFQTVESNQLAKNISRRIIYAGLEDD